MTLTPMRQSATLKHISIRGLYGPTYTSSTITCRFAQETKLIKQANGQEIISNAVIRTASVIGNDDIITYGGKDYPVLSVATITGIGGSILEYEVRL